MTKVPACVGIPSLLAGEQRTFSCAHCRVDVATVLVVVVAAAVAVDVSVAL